MQKSSFPLAAVLTIIFVAAKVFGFIDWSWLWVLSPLWIAVSIGILAAIGYIIFQIWIETRR